MVMNDNRCCYFSVRNLEKQQYNERYENLKSNVVFFVKIHTGWVERDFL